MKKDFTNLRDDQLEGLNRSDEEIYAGYKEFLTSKDLEEMLHKKDFTNLRDDQLEDLGMTYHEEGCYWEILLDCNEVIMYHKATNEVEFKNWTKCVKNESWLAGFIEAAEFLP